MICDPRMTSKPYGKVFLNSLPEMEFKTNIEEVNEFFVQHETS
jgi:hypothetical protein